MTSIKTVLPALHGGTPVRSNFLDFSRPVISYDEKQSVIEVLDSGWLTTGKKAAEFERNFADYIGSEFALAVNSCTAGLFLALKVLSVGPEDEIITTTNTFPATANVIEHLGAKPVFCDINLDDGNIDVSQIARKVTPQTKGIMPVHFAGAPCSMDDIQSIARYYELFTVSDCAHAVETKWYGRNVGQLADISAYSFYATKNLTTGEGGMVVTDDESLYNQMRILRLHGLSADAEARYSKNGKYGYDLLAAGYKFNMPDILAALGLVQLENIHENHERRIELDEFYRNNLKGIPCLSTLKMDDTDSHAHHLFPILIDFEKLRCDKVEFMAGMKAENIGVSQHFKPLHLYTYYKEKYGYTIGAFPNAEKFGDQVITLPFSQYLEFQDAKDVIESIKKLIMHYII
jgi:dTDP-4-amino-4,6-dideoxygalactose transaminase